MPLAQHPTATKIAAVSKGEHACYGWIVSSRLLKNGERQLRINLTMEIPEENQQYFQSGVMVWLDLTAPQKVDEDIALR